MKKGMCLNSELSYVISKMGHFDCMAIGDAGLPIPDGVKRIDLAVSPGVPAFLQVFEAAVSELQVQKMTVASEMKEEKRRPLHVPDRICAEKRDRGGGGSP